MNANDLFDLRALTIRVGFKYALLTKDLEFKQWLHPVASDPPSITCDGTRDVTRTLDGLTLTPDETAVINPIQDRLQVYLSVPDADDTQDHSLGVFMFTETPRRVTTMGAMTTCSLQDQSLVLDNPREFVTSVAPGGSFRSKAIEILTEALLPASRISIDASTETASAGTSWRPGENRLKTVRELLAKAGMYSFFDKNGVFRGTPVPEDLTRLTPDVTYTEGQDVRRRVIGDGYDETDDLWASPNRYVVVSTNADLTSIRGVYDVPASAPHSIQNRGWVNAEVIDEQGIPNNATARLRAIYAYLHDNKALRYVTFDGPPDPRHDTHTIVEFDGEQHSELSWTMRLDPSNPVMTHRIAKLYRD